jgi:uridine kinase
MRVLAEKNLPIERNNVTTDSAQEYFARTGQADRLRILNYRQYDHFTLYHIGDGPEDYYYGEMVPSTGSVDIFSVVPYGPGVVLMQPDLENPEQSAPFKDLPKLWNIYQETAAWNRILNCENAADLNEMIENHRLREFIRVNEALQERKIQSIADQFIASGARLILIAGPSSSGKTTFSHRLSIALRVQGLRPVKISLDDYYRNREDLPVEPDGSVDLERIETLDTDLISDHLRRLMAGETVNIPVFDFHTGTRTDKTHPFCVEEGQPILIEGIHGLNEKLTEGIDRKLKFKIYISALTMLNLDDHNRIRTTDARLLRRIVRDQQFRGTPPEKTMSMWRSVRHGEENYIFPYQEEADVMINSSLTYELPIMKKYAYPALRAVTPSSPHYTLAQRLVKFLNYIQTADVEDEIPVNSILREFIGGCCFYRETD